MWAPRSWERVSACRRDPAPAVKDALPGGGEDDGGAGEGNEQAEPETAGAEMEVEGEHAAERHSEKPVADEVRVHGCGGAARAAHGASNGDLDAVEELEAGGDHQ